MADPLPGAGEELADGGTDGHVGLWVVDVVVEVDFWVVWISNISTEERGS